MPQTPPDPLAFARQYAALAERAQRLLADTLSRPQLPQIQRSLIDQATAAWGTVAEGWKQDPTRLLQSAQTFWQDYAALCQGAARKWMGKDDGTAPSPVAATPRDKRFAGDGWQQNATFDFLKQSYLLTANWVQRTAAETPGLDAKSKAKVEFFTRQWVDALSPSNFWLTNPEALQRMAETNGESLLQGFRNLVQDFERGDGTLQISMTNPASYRLGETLAATPGRVVFRNRLLELIQYAPLTETVAAAPLLILPPWINKYYILDLKPDNSFIRHAVAAGHTVFVASWVNPDASLGEVDFGDYLTEGALAALAEVERICGTRQTNIVGYCLGGTLLACLLAHLTAKGEAQRVASATYLTALVDFSEPGDLGVFIDEDQVTAIEAQMLQRGYLDAAAMATTFNLLRANDLIWSFVVNNYLLGREPLPFDLLYWNADATNLPAAMHSTYLRQMYLNNRLRQPGGMTMAGTPLDLTSIMTPSYIVAARDDHIAPWQSVWQATRIYRGPVDFVLAGSGHIAGMINPPGPNGEKGKYGYWESTQKTDDPDAWLRDAAEIKGSWWPHWLNWLGNFSGGQVPARVPENGLEAAPGNYVKVRAM